MSRRPAGSVPSLVHHRPSGRARVRINGRDHWLGKWGSPEARLAYDRLITEYVATRRVRETDAVPAPPEPEAIAIDVSPTLPGLAVQPASTSGRSETHAPAEATVAEVMLPYLEHCDTYYRTPSGERTSTYGNVLQAAGALRPRKSWDCGERLEFFARGCSFWTGVGSQVVRNRGI